MSWLQVILEEKYPPGDDIPEFIEGYIDLSAVDAIREECSGKECRLIFINSLGEELGYVYVSLKAKYNILNEITSHISKSKRGEENLLLSVDNDELWFFHLGDKEWKPWKKA